MMEDWMDGPGTAPDPRATAPGVVIVGAGMAGLLAARMLADHEPVVLERQSRLPNNHHAVLRFRTEAVSLATSIPFKRVRVIKAVVGSLGNPVADANAYALKVTGKLQPRSILSVEPVDRFIAPPDFIKRLATGTRIRFDRAYGKDHLNASEISVDLAPVISTMPLPILARILGYPDLGDFTTAAPIGDNFIPTEGWSMRMRLPAKWQASVYATLYAPDWSYHWYRASIMGDELVIEGVDHLELEHHLFVVQEVANALGLRVDVGNDPSHRVEYNETQYQKTAEPTPEMRERCKRFIMWATATHSVYSLGRFATWRPGLLLDDVVNDVNVIRRLMEGGSVYTAVKGG